jgi:phosphoribosylanthranilate isomerase
VIVQIYEVSTPEEAVALEALGVDHIGVLVGRGAFPRELPATSARAIFRALRPATKRLALSLSDRLEEVASVVADTMPDIIQVGAAVELLSVERMRELKASFPDVLLMRAIPVIGEESLVLAKQYAHVADFLLLDSYAPGDKQIGALGRTHDWRISRRIAEAVNTPIILAGGLGPENVAAAIRAVRPHGVDSKTGTDCADGSGKDREKVRAFVTAAKLPR